MSSNTETGRMNDYQYIRFLEDQERALEASNKELLAALRAAAANLAALSDTVAAYPRPSNDPDGHLLLTAREQSKAAAFAARAAIAKEEGI